MSALGNAEQRAKELYAARFAGTPSVSASAPGRVELAGNHTDHQGGRTIAGAIDRRAHAFAAPNGSGEVRVVMGGFGEVRMSCSDLAPRENERATSAALVRGMAAARARSGKPLGGFDMAVASDIPAGSGVSSSAAFEVLVGAAMRALFDRSGEPSLDELIALALEGVQAERAYFGKPCGAQDQIACALGGIVAMDFSEETPRAVPIAFDVDACAFSLCLIDSRCDHAAFTEEYAAVPADMRDVAHLFGSDRLEEVPQRAFFENLPRVRTELGDRKTLRALHYFDETKRVLAQQRALEAGDFEAFLAQVRRSGASSAEFLQNVSPRLDASGAHQPAMVILALCSHLLGAAGAYRIHGGGFGGSVLAFVPSRESEAFAAAMDGLLGYRACMPVSLGQPGAYGIRLA